MSVIHPTAIIDPSARLADDVEVGPYAIIGPGVEIGSGTTIGSHTVIRRFTRIGRNNRIFQFASIGEDPQDLKYQGEETWLEIGDNNTIREFVTLNRGTAQDRGVTTIGSNCLLMAYCHVGHDCVLGDRVILANAATLGGHVHIDDWAIVGGQSAVHQFCRIGAHVMCGGGSIVLQDIPAYLMVTGHPAEPHGINYEGLRRRGFDKPALQALRRAYKTVYREGLRLSEAVEQLRSLAREQAVVQVFIDSIEASTRGIVR